MTRPAIKPDVARREPSPERSLDDGDLAPLLGSRVVLVIRDRPRPFPAPSTTPLGGTGVSDPPSSDDDPEPEAAGRPLQGRGGPAGEALPPRNGAPREASVLKVQRHLRDGNPLDGLATELSSAAQSFSSITSGLAAEAWQGGASAAMLSTAAQYTGVLSAAAAQAQTAAAQAQTVASAFESAPLCAVKLPQQFMHSLAVALAIDWAANGLQQLRRAQHLLERRIIDVRRVSMGPVIKPLLGRLIIPAHPRARDRGKESQTYNHAA